MAKQGKPSPGKGKSKAAKKTARLAREAGYKEELPRSGKAAKDSSRFIERKTGPAAKPGAGKTGAAKSAPKAAKKAVKPAKPVKAASKTPAGSATKPLTRAAAAKKAATKTATKKAAPKKSAAKKVAPVAPTVKAAKATPKAAPKVTLAPKARAAAKPAPAKAVSKKTTAPLAAERPAPKGPTKTGSTVAKLRRRTTPLASTGAAAPAKATRPRRVSNSKRLFGATPVAGERPAPSTGHDAPAAQPAPEHLHANAPEVPAAAAEDLEPPTDFKTE